MREGEINDYLFIIIHYIFEIYTKFCVFYTHHEGVKNICFDPTYVPMRFFEAVPGRARAIKKILLPVSHILHQTETTAG
jgi:hypothetical protein